MQLAPGRPLLRAHRRPRRQHRRAGALHRHRLAARARRRGPLPPAQARATHADDRRRRGRGLSRWRVDARRRCVVGAGVGALATSPSGGRRRRRPTTPATGQRDAARRPPSRPSARPPAQSLARAGRGARRPARSAWCVADADGARAAAATAGRALPRRRHADALVDEAVESHLRRRPGGARAGRTRSSSSGRPGARSWCAARWSASTARQVGAVATIEDVTERAASTPMRTDFVANISHELKTPVGALALLAETLADEDDPEVVAPAGRQDGRRGPPRRPASSTTC